MIYQLGCSIYFMFLTRVQKVDSLNCLGLLISAFLVKPEEQGSGSPVRVAPFRRLQKCTVQVPALSITTWYVVISSSTWDRIFGCYSDDIAEVLVGQIHMQRIWWQQTLCKFVGQCIVVAPVGLQKFHCLTGLLGTGRASLGGTISEGRCCDLGNFSKMRLSGTQLSGPTLTNIRSGLVPVFRQPE